MSTPTKRSTRIEEPSIDLDFRDESRNVIRLDIMREDVLGWRPAPTMDPQFYLVLDFGREERFTRLDTEQVPPEPQYEDTGRIVLSLQPVEFDPDTWSLEDAVGLGPEVVRFADAPSDLLGDRPDSEPVVGRPLVGWTRHAVSTRRT